MRIDAGVTECNSIVFDCSYETVLVAAFFVHMKNVNYELCTCSYVNNSNVSS